MAYLVIVLLAGLTVIFGVSAVSKIRHSDARRAFTDSLRELRILPARVVVAAASTVIAAEALVAVVAGAALILTALRGRMAFVAFTALALAAALLAALTASLAVALRRGSEAHCACFGVGRRLGRAHLIRNVVLLVAVTGGFFGAVGSPATSAEPAGAVLGVIAGAVAGILVTQLDELIDLFSTHQRSA